MTLFKCLARPAPLSLLLLLTTITASAAGNMYRYPGKSGNPVISHTLPQDASQRGYDILSANGRVVETVAPALTKIELAVKKAREVESLRQAEATRKRQNEDRQLLRSYSHPDDLIKVLHRRLEQMRSLISLKQGSINSLQEQIRYEQSRAADSERAGREIPAAIPPKIESLEREVATTETEILRQQEKIAIVVSDYSAKVARLETLTEQNRTLDLNPTVAERDSTAH